MPGSPSAHDGLANELQATVQDSRAGLRIAALIFFQMLPATLLTPAIRPLFASQHGGNEHAMHAFMALNMLGAALLVPWLGARAERLARPRLLVTGLLALDALLLCLLPTAMPTGALLVLRTLEGAAHVGATSLLMAEAAALGRATGQGRVMGMAGAALMFAVALGSALGGQLVHHDPRAPFWVGAGLQAALALVLPLVAAQPLPRSGCPTRLLSLLREQRELWAPLGAVFVGRFTVGCLVVTFALFAHRQHGASDRAVGWLFSLVTLPFALSMYPISRLSDRVSRAGVMVFGAVGYGAAFFLIGHAPFALLPPLMIVAGITSACLFAPCLCYAAALGGARKEGAMALLNTAGCLGMLLGPAFAGITSALAGGDDPVAGYRVVFSAGALSVLLWLVLSARWLARRNRLEISSLLPPAMQ